VQVVLALSPITLGKRIDEKAGEKLRVTREDRSRLAREQHIADWRTRYEKALTRVKGLLRDRGASSPSCFVRGKPRA